MKSCKHCGYDGFWIMTHWIKCPSRFISAQEFAKRAGVSDYAIRKGITAGRIRAKKLGHAWLIREEEVRKYIKNRPYQRGRKSNENNRMVDNQGTVE